MADSELQRAVISASTVGDNEIVAADSPQGRAIRVINYSLVCTAAAVVTFESGTSGPDLTGDMSFAANGGISCADAPAGHFETDAGESLNLRLGGTGPVEGHLTYVFIE